MNLPSSFYRSDDVVSIARSLLGKWLFTSHNGILTGGIIAETEAYGGTTDRACHAYNNRRTKRTEVMYSPGGITYVYLCYGLHHLLNVVTGPLDTPHAVLIRGLIPLIGIDTMAQRRKKKISPLLSGPAVVTTALGIDQSHNALSLYSKKIWIEERNTTIPTDKILTGPRIGIAYAKEDALLPWRFQIDSTHAIESTQNYAAQA